MMRSLLISSRLETWCMPSGWLTCCLHWTPTNFCPDQPQATCVVSGMIQSCTSQIHYQCSSGLSFLWATMTAVNNWIFQDLLSLDIDLLWWHLQFPGVQCGRIGWKNGHKLQNQSASGHSFTASFNLLKFFNHSEPRGYYLKNGNIRVYCWED